VSELKLVLEEIKRLTNESNRAFDALREKHEREIEALQREYDAKLMPLQARVLPLLGYTVGDRVHLRDVDAYEAWYHENVGQPCYWEGRSLLPRPTEDTVWIVEYISPTRVNANCENRGISAPHDMFVKAGG
jgi:hypothetical protein